MKSFRCQVIEKAEAFGLKKSEATALYQAIMLIMQDTLRIKGVLTLRNFGTFRVKKVKSRIIQSRIINDGKPTKTKSQKNVKFKASDNLKRFLNR